MRRRSDTHRDAFNSDRRSDAATWMRDLRVRHRTFAQLRIPGSHQSPTSVIYASDPLDSRFNRFYPANRMLPCIFSQWSVCQRMNMEEQLEAGVRFFDIRVSRSIERRGFFASHSFRSVSIRACFDHIRNFYERHGTSEVIVVCMKPDYQNRRAFQKDPEAKRKFAELLGGHPCQKYFSRLPDPISRPLNTFGGSPIILFVEKNLWTPQCPGYVRPSFFFKWFDVNTNVELRKSVEQAIATISANRSSHLSVVQNILTPRSSDIATSVALYAAVAVSTSICFGVAISFIVRGSIGRFCAVLGGISFGGLLAALWGLRSRAGVLASCFTPKDDFLNRHVRGASQSQFNVVTVDGINRTFCREVFSMNERFSSP